MESSSYPLCFLPLLDPQCVPVGGQCADCRANAACSYRVQYDKGVEKRYKKRLNELDLLRHGDKRRAAARKRYHERKNSVVSSPVIRELESQIAVLDGEIAALEAASPPIPHSVELKLEEVHSDTA